MLVTRTQVQPVSLQTSSSLAPGGAERQLVTTLTALHGHPAVESVALFCISATRRNRRDFYLPQLQEAGIEVLSVGAEAVAAAWRSPAVRPHKRLIRSFPDDMIDPIALWLAEFARRRPAVVHAWQDQTILTAVVAAALAGVPRIVFGTRSVRPDNPRRRLRSYMEAAYRETVRLPAVTMIGNSRAGADDYAAWLGLDPGAIRVVYNGIDFDRLERSADPARPAAIRAELGIPAAAPVLGGVFRMSEEKRPLLWIEAAAETAKARPDAHFLVCGDGPMKEDMRRLALERGIAERLHLPGSQTDIANWYRAMDCVLLTSRHEGLPNVLMEAQSLGVPVVTTKVGGAPEVVEEGRTGFAVPDATGASLAAAILRVVGEPAWRAAASARGRVFVRENFGVDAMARKTLWVYGFAP